MNILDILLILVIIQLFVPYFQRWLLVRRRLQAIQLLEGQRKSRVITLIHRSETLRFFGFPFSRNLDMEDSEQILRAIHLTPDDMSIDIILHTPGGLALAAEQIAVALGRHKGKVTVFVPHYAMSGGTLIALAADEVVLSRDAVLGSVDPALGVRPMGLYPAASVIEALKQPNPHRDDQTLILGDIAEKALKQIYDLLHGLLINRYESKKAATIARMLSEGRWTHDHPLFYEQLQEIGLPVSDAMPADVFELMKLYSQFGQRRPSVEYIPTSYYAHPKAKKEQIGG